MAGGQPPLHCGAPGCTAVPAGGPGGPQGEVTLRVPLPTLGNPQHHPLVSSPPAGRVRALGPRTSAQTWRSRGEGTAAVPFFLLLLPPQPPCPRPHIRPALRAHTFKGLLPFLGQDFLAFGQRPLQNLQNEAQAHHGLRRTELAGLTGGSPAPVSARSSRSGDPGGGHSRIGPAVIPLSRAG